MLVGQQMAILKSGGKTLPAKKKLMKVLYYFSTDLFFSSCKEQPKEFVIAPKSRINSV